ncbi:MAG: OB-fold domain-containing protein [Alphaproteobacteria bacterium]|tara:strand:+ start:1017 stop:1424 length:408 start_codon:yes stop_codon:yes gene_type:complete
MEFKKPRPAIDPDSKIYWESAENNKLMVQYSLDTKEYFLYSKQLTNSSDSKNIIWKEVSGKGKVYSFTAVHVPAGPAFKEDTPYIVASIELDEGARIISNILTDNIDAISIGDKVSVIFEKQDDGFIIPKFKLEK